MKRKFLFLFLSVSMFLAPMNNEADTMKPGKYSFFTGLGFQTGQLPYPKVCIDFVAEMRFIKNIYGQILVDIYINEKDDLPDSIIWRKVHTTGIGLYSVYRSQPSKHLTFNFMAGMYVFFRGNRIKVKDPITNNEIYINNDETTFYPSLGGEIQKLLNKRLGLFIKGILQANSEDGSIHPWFRIYGGFFYRLK